jgi:DNA-binding transcriptional regulator YdaS (Cro superfamily)
MEKLLAFLNALPMTEREPFAAKCETSVGYLRKAISIEQKLGETLCMMIERNTAGVIRREDLRPDIDWSRAPELCEGSEGQPVPPAASVEPVRVAA